jgi:hypothetical protein
MKIVYLKFIGVLLYVLLVTTAFGQWNTSGNFTGDGSGISNTNNILGTQSGTNIPIRLQTNGVNRLFINQSGATEAQTGNGTEGFVGIGPDPNVYSRLTLSGDDVDVGGYRLWMKTGTFMHHYSDAMYVGLQSLDTSNRSDAVISWSDDPSNNSTGIDKLRFLFTAPVAGGTGTNPRAMSSISGYEFMQMTPFPSITNSAGSAIGHVGIGPMFSNSSLPQNRLHINAEDNLTTFLQISNESGTGQTANDGLRIGYPTTTSNNKEVQINQREDDRLSLYTNNGERMRITHTDALNNGVDFNPGNFFDPNLTRIGISHDPANPVTRPLSLLHLGYNVNNPSSNDGWRSWMDVGIFTSRATDHLYIGMKDEPNGSDAVLSWGDNNLIDGAGPDNFRMIFTTPLSVGLGPGNSPNGVEGMRMSPTFDLTNANIGIKTGIGGDPTANQYFGAGVNPTATLEVNAWGSSPTTANGAPADPIIGGTPTGLSGLRFTDLRSNSTPQLNPGTGVLSVDAEGDVIYVPSNTAPNIGNYCTQATNPITANFEVPLDNHNYYFSGQSTNTDVDYIGSSVGIGLDCGDPIPLAKFHVLQSTANADYVNEDNININASLAGYFENDAVGEITGGIKAYAHGESDQLIGGFFEAEAAGNDPSQTAFGVWSEAVNALAINAGVVGSAENGDYNYGVYGRAYIGSNNYAIYGEVDSNTNSWAGFFDGDVYTSTSYSSSDVKLKNKINDFNSKDALNLIQMMKPKTYEYKQSAYPSLHLPTGPQIGLLAQEVEKAIPQLVRDVVHPPKFDNKGKIIHPEVSFKGVNYIGLIPILVGAVQEQQQELAQKDSAIAIMQGQLDRVQQAIDNLTALVSTCCTTGQQMMKKEGEEVHTNDITLADLDAIILNQNVPNPFSEQTEITYYLPKDVSKATFVFYNLEGKQINALEVNQRGNGKLTVFADDLSSGVYTYSLVVDGKIAETKRMTKTK